MAKNMNDMQMVEPIFLDSDISSKPAVSTVGFDEIFKVI